MNTATITDIAGAVTTALAELGNTADAVANALLAKGIKGHCNDLLGCPIANLILTVPGVETVEVIDTHAIVWTADREFEVDLPAPVAQFVTWFDKKIFLALIDEPAVTR